MCLKGKTQVDVTPPVAEVLIISTNYLIEVFQGYSSITKVYFYRCVGETIERSESDFSLTRFQWNTDNVICCGHFKILSGGILANSADLHNMTKVFTIYRP